MTDPETPFHFAGARINNYTIVNLIGSGSYGLVFLVKDIHTNIKFAMKVISKSFHVNSEKQSPTLKKDLFYNLSHFRELNRLNLLRLANRSNAPHYNHPFIREISLHLQVHTHPNIITIHEILDSHMAVFVIMDYYPEGDLFYNIVEKSRYIESSPKFIRRVFSQLIDAISFCHNKGIYHCDIKPENIMCTNNGGKLVIGDFGLSTVNTYMSSEECIGSSYYMPPERLISMLDSKSNGNPQHNNPTTNPGPFTTLNRSISYPSSMGDLWSLGIILINLTCMRNPWGKACSKVDDNYRNYQSNPAVLKELLPLSDEFYDILIKCLKENPYDRISLFELRKLVVSCSKFTTEGPLSIEEPITDSESSYIDFLIRVQYEGIQNADEDENHDEEMEAFDSLDDIGLEDSDYFIDSAEEHVEESVEESSEADSYSSSDNEDSDYENRSIPKPWFSDLQRLIQEKTVTDVVQHELTGYSGNDNDHYDIAFLQQNTFNYFD